MKVNPDTGRPDPNGMTVPEKGKYQFGHAFNNEWWRYKQEAEANGYDRRRVIEDQNDPNRYQIQTPQSNQGHRYEAPK
ncbi:GH-E family nuclease [Sciscionella marina]|uniref:GH-E family nuclease n=1 Tax=Sciscionella marina TaxID=508770 RepID=UPI000376FF7C|nr:GH-E family nuclease [Sciscionella marina]